MTLIEIELEGTPTVLGTTVMGGLDDVVDKLNAFLRAQRIRFGLEFKIESYGSNTELIRLIVRDAGAFEKLANKLMLKYRPIAAHNHSLFLYVDLKNAPLKLGVGPEVKALGFKITNLAWMTSYILDKLK